MSTDRFAPARAWVRLAQPGVGRINLLRPAGLVVFAAFALFIAWWFPQHPDPYSSRWAGKAAFIAFTTPPVAAGLLAMATARVLVSVRVVAALYGRACGGAVEVTGFAGRFGWVFSRRRFGPGQILVDVTAGGPQAMPAHLIRLTQGSTQLTVWVDAPWDEATVPGIIAWLGEHGIEAVMRRPPP